MREGGVSRCRLIWRTYYCPDLPNPEENCVHCCNLLDKTLQCRYPLCPHIHTHRRKGQGGWVQSPCFFMPDPPPPTVRDTPPSYTLYTPLTQNGKTINPNKKDDRKNDKHSCHSLFLSSTKLCHRDSHQFILT